MSYPENQNQYADFDEYEGDDLSGGPQPKSSNRTFFISFGLIAVIFALTLAALAFVIFYVLPQSREKRESQNIQIYAANTATAMAATQMAESLALAAAQAEEATSTVAPTFTPLPSSTPTPELEEITIGVGGGEPTEAMGVGGGMDGRTATLAVLQTQAAAARLTAAAAGLTTTALPETGIMDGVGLPGLAGLTAVLGVVIFAARKLRSNNR
ncbi:MAG: LPXTG cell wall anchor domain-containing protein [Leptolinea sp.]|jgi:LPXTG-motif cell wall-anchored protein|nr:LPXTG cell wall anchor domain-containing protein [Leptolinea sp.]